ncbi:MAG: hypothetical protein F4Z92_12665 [Gemmatimonadetes bacterium]|nr:hypothetical protein [Gemmatimonadota bacterium]
MAKASLPSGFPVAPGLAGRVLLLAIPVVLPAAGCGDSAVPNLPASQVRDSAGVRIVENARPAADSRLPWRSGPAPTVSIGEVTGAEAYLLHRADDAVMLPDDRIVVANTGTSEIRVFNASGLHQATLGREGGGPGEFTALAGVAMWPGDSLVAWDTRARTIAVFDSDGALGRAFVLEAEGRPAEPRMPLTDGTVLGRIVDSGAGPGYRRERYTYELHDSDGSTRVSLGDHPGRESFINMDGRMAVFGLLPFSRSLHEASWGESVVLTPDDHYEVRVHDRTTGALARIVRREYTNRAPTREEVDQAIDDALERTSLTGDQLEWTREGYKGMPLVESFPAFRTLLTDELNHLWIRETTLPGMDRPAPLWTVFDPEGRVLGFVETPEGLTILEIGAEYILGHTTDDLGVESVQVWPLVRAAG